MSNRKTTTPCETPNVYATAAPIAAPGYNTAAPIIGTTPCDESIPYNTAAPIATSTPCAEPTPAGYAHAAATLAADAYGYKAPIATPGYDQAAPIATPGYGNQAAAANYNVISSARTNTYVASAIVAIALCAF
ncbi:hypothetical protein BC833DRAFT_661735 [Globomyces pollinis-pini]|nr:hypothetical protein BC833DRAFT_661735 [Globomyces pollinis-pini]